MREKEREPPNAFIRTKRKKKRRKKFKSFEVT